MEIYNCKRIIVLKYFEIGTDREGNRVDYTRYICLPYNRKRDQSIRSFLAQINFAITKYPGWYVKRKTIAGEENINEYLEHLKCKVTKLRDDDYEIREPITAKVYTTSQILPHEVTLKYDLPNIFNDFFGEHFVGEETAGVDLRKL